MIRAIKTMQVMTSSLWKASRAAIAPGSTIKVITMVGWTVLASTVVLDMVSIFPAGAVTTTISIVMVAMMITTAAAVATAMMTITMIRIADIAVAIVMMMTTMDAVVTMALAESLDS